MTQGNIAKYLVQVGDSVSAGDRIAEIETDKATVDFDVTDEGTVAKILVAEGTHDVQVPLIQRQRRVGGKAKGWRGEKERGGKREDGGEED